MSTAVLDRPVWKMAVASMLPAQHRDKAMDKWIHRLPLLLILVVQMLTSIRLSNSAFQDEALYLSYGHWERTGDLVANHIQPSKFFSGAPQLYPVFASYLNSLGGLTAARLFSTLCMLSATVAVYWMTTTLFAHRGLGMRPALFAAMTFSFAAPVMFLGFFATFDAPAFAAIAWAAALAVWSSKGGKSVLWSVPVGFLCALAIGLKYSAAIDVPFVLLLTLVGWPVRAWRTRTVMRGLLAGGTALVVLVGSALTWAKADLVGLKFTTTHRNLGAKTPALTLVHDVLSWSGVPIVLMAVGGLYLLRRQPVLALVLGAGLCAAMASQIHQGELTSLHKHVVLGLIFGAPLAGILLARLSYWARPLGTLIVGVSVWVALLTGLNQSAALFSVWPNTTGLVQTIQYSFKSMSYLRAVGDIPEPVQYAIKGHTHPWQFTSTYADSFFYKGLSGLPAYQAALKAGYFQVAFLDGSTPIGAALKPEMKSFPDWKKAQVVTAPDGHKWDIWQRFIHLS